MHYPVTADPWLGIDLIASTRWIYVSGSGYRLSVTATDWGKVGAGWGARGAAWDEVKAKTSGTRENTQVYEEQLLCHFDGRAAVIVREGYNAIGIWRDGARMCPTPHTCRPCATRGKPFHSDCRRMGSVMDVRSSVVRVSVVIAIAGAAVLAIAWTTGSVEWLLADVPGVDNDVLREFGLGVLGVAFLVVAVVGLVVSRTVGNDGAGPRASTGATALSMVLCIVGLLFAVVGAGQFAAQSAAQTLAPALARAEDLHIPGGDGRVVVLVGLALAIASLLVVARSRSTASSVAAVPISAR